MLHGDARSALSDSLNNQQEGKVVKWTYSILFTDGISIGTKKWGMVRNSIFFPALLLLSTFPKRPRCVKASSSSFLSVPAVGGWDARCGVSGLQRRGEERRGEEKREERRGKERSSLEITRQGHTCAHKGMGCESRPCIHTVVVVHPHQRLLSPHMYNVTYVEKSDHRTPSKLLKYSWPSAIKLFFNTWVVDESQAHVCLKCKGSVRGRKREKQMTGRKSGLGTVAN